MIARTRRAVVVAGTTIAMLLTLGACGGDDGSDDGDEPLVFWTLETQPERVARTEKNLEEFTKKTGIEVDLVPIEEVDVAQTMLTSAAAGTLPDVVDHGMIYTNRWVSEGVLDAEAAQEVIEKLDPATFRQVGLDFATVDGEYAAVPTSGWGFLMYYRKDWFAEAGLAAPDSFENILAAAKALHDPDNSVYGIVIGNDPAHEVTQQIFEDFALANGCQLIDENGELTITSDECVETFEFYNELLKFGPPGTNQSDQQRAMFLAGQAAMIPQSPFVLHRFAGLQDGELPSCPECESDPRFLADNTGIVTAPVEGFHGESARYGRLQNLGITVDAQTEEAQMLVEYLLTDGYPRWLSQVPNGMIPMRLGTPDDPAKYLTAWQDLEMGVDRMGTVVEFFGEQAATEIATSVEDIQAWGFEQGYADLIGALYETYVLPAAVREVQEGALSPEEAAERVAEELSAELE